MASRRNALGKGLGALIPSGPKRSEPTASEETTSGQRTVPIGQIVANPDQPRRYFDPEELERLASSIRQYGVLQPVVVRRSGERFELLVGERRWRASKLAGLESLPVVVADTAPQERLEIALVENVQRADLNPIELALAFKELADGGATQERIGERVGLDRSSIANHLRLLDLPKEFQEDVETGRLSTGHAKALLQISNPERRRHLRDRILKDALSVREAERQARGAPAPATRRETGAETGHRDPDLEHLLDRLRRQLQTKIRIIGDAKRGRLEIAYFSPEDLERVVGALLDAR